MQCTRALIFVALVPLLFAQGCTHPAAVAIPELDSSVISYSRLESGKLTEAEMRQQFGESPADHQMKGGERLLIYPIRVWTPVRRGIVPAAILRVQFDRGGVVTDWYFFHPRTNQRLEVAETLSEAQYAVSQICKADGRAPMLVLETNIQRGQSTMGDIHRLMVEFTYLIFRFHPSRGFPYPRKVPIANGEAWDFYVDRPSPIFIPPFYYYIEFNPAGVAKSRGGASGYGGCI